MTAHLENYVKLTLLPFHFLSLALVSESINIFQFSRPDQPLPNHGILAWRRHDDAPDEKRHIVGRMHAILHCGNGFSDRFDTQIRIHSSGHQTGQFTVGRQRPPETVRFRAVHRFEEVASDRFLSGFESG